MTTKVTEEKKDLTGLENTVPENKKAAEYDLVTSLLEAAAFRTSEDAITEVEIKRGGKYFFTVHIHPISDRDARKARKKATVYMPNPNNRKLPPIEKDFDSAAFHSLLIYYATTDEDKQKIWGNKTVMDKYDVLEPHETVDVLLQVGEKLEIVDIIMDISGLDDEEATPEDYAKN